MSETVEQILWRQLDECRESHKAASLKIDSLASQLKEKEGEIEHQQWQIDCYARDLTEANQRIADLEKELGIEKQENKTLRNRITTQSEEISKLREGLEEI